MTRRSLGGLVLAAWLAAIGWLAWRQLTGEGDGLEGVSRRLVPGASFYAVTVAGTPIGLASLTLDTTTIGYRVVDVLSLDLPGLPGGAARQVLRAEHELSRTFRLGTSDLSLSDAGLGIQVSASITRDSLLGIRIGRAGQRPELVQLFPLDEFTVPSAVPMRIASARDLVLERSRSFLVLDLLGERVEGNTSRVAAESTFVVADSAVRQVDGTWDPVITDTVAAWRVDRLGGAAGSGWIDPEGRPLRLTFPLGVTLERGPFELVSQEYQRKRRDGLLPALPQLAGSTVLRQPSLGPASGTVTVVVSRLDGPAPPGAAALFAGGRQRVAGDTVRIGGEPAAGASPPMRYRNTQGSLATGGPLVARALRLALERHGSAGDTLAALTTWVARDLLHDPSDDAPLSPAAVLSAGRAGPEGKARLLVTLARAAGLPARVVSGVVVSDPSLPAHTWVEIWRDGWRAVDPSSGSLPASADLLRVAEGPARPAALVPVVGALRLTMISRSPREGRQ